MLKNQRNLQPHSGPYPLQLNIRGPREQVLVRGVVIPHQDFIHPLCLSAARPTPHSASIAGNASNARAASTANSADSAVSNVCRNRTHLPDSIKDGSFVFRSDSRQAAAAGEATPLPTKGNHPGPAGPVRISGPWSLVPGPCLSSVCRNRLVAPVSMRFSTH